MPNFRASVGHNPLVRVKRANPLNLSGQSVGLTLGVGSSLYFSDGFESGTTSSWTAVGGDGTAPTFYTSGGVGGSAYSGTRFIGWTLNNGDTADDHSIYLNYGTPGQIGTQIRGFFSQFAVSYESTFGLATGEQKLCIYQYYRQSAPSFSNAFRKYQVIPCVLANGRYGVSLTELDDNGNFLRNSVIGQNSTTFGPGNSGNQWDTLRIEVILDSNGSQVAGEYGQGFGNGVVRMWRNNTLILEHTNLNIVRAESVGMGRILLTPAHSPHLWNGPTQSIYYDQFQIASGAGALTAMPSSTVGRTVNNNPDGLPVTSTVLFSRDYETQIASEIDTSPTIVTFEYGAYGYGGNGWRAVPNPLSGLHPGSAEDSAGWNYLGSAATTLVTVSYMLKMSAALLNNIKSNSNGGNFWSSSNKAMDLGSGSTRYGAHFGKQNTSLACEGQPVVSDTNASSPRWYLVAGGGGPYYRSNLDWNQFADIWTWICFVVDIRGSTAATRYEAMYYKAEGMTSVVSVGKVLESSGFPNLTGLSAIPLHVLTPLWGYWDDMHDREAVASQLSSMSLQVDRIRVMPGWPDATNGPPF